MTTLREEILELSRQNQIEKWSSINPFNQMLDELIESGDFRPTHDLEFLNASIIRDTAAYRVETGVGTVVIGMSGGVDSALTAAIFKKAGYRVIGVTMPINQDPAETQRGVEACEAIGIEHRHVDLTDAYADLKPHLGDPSLLEVADTAVRIRLGNVRARLRMITLYNLASLEGGFVASTDNFSELAAGFWTLHGDVGDFSPIQSLLKSWEVPYLARLNGVPESTVTATPTDGLGISNGDEAQLGCSYLEWDILTLSVARALERLEKHKVAIRGFSDDSLLEELREFFHVDAIIYPKFEAVMRRIGGSWFKRQNPLNVRNPLADRYAMIDRIDNDLFVPKSFKK